MNVNRAIRPEPKGEINFNLPEIESFELDNGLKVLYVKKERIPAIQLSLICNAGSSYDPVRKKGMAVLLASMLDEGAGEFGALQLSDELEYLGAVLNLFSDQDSLFVSLLTLTENFDRALHLFSSVITKPHLAEPDFLREKNKILVRILQAKDDAGYLASTLFEQIVFGNDNPYGLPEIGTTTSVERIYFNDLKIFYNTLITPNNSTLVVVGKIDKSELKDKLTSALQSWNNYTPPIFEFQNPDTSKTKIYFIHKEDAAQSEIRIGHISPKRNQKDFFARALMNNILGGQFSSRINLNLREDKGYTYGAHSAFTYHKHSAYFCVSASVNQQNTGDSIIEVLKEINYIRSEITDKELRFAKSSMIRKFPSLFETYGQIARNLASKVIHSLPDDYFNNYINNVKAVELNDVLAAAQTFIYPQSLIILTVGDRNIVKPQLEKLSIAEIVELDAGGNKIIN